MNINMKNKNKIKKMKKLHVDEKIATMYGESMCRVGTMDMTQYFGVSDLCVEDRMMISYQWQSSWLACSLWAAVLFLGIGCSGLPAGGGGGVTSEPRFIEGTFESSPKTGQAGQDYEVATIVFAKNGKFKAYRTKQSLAKQVPEIEGSYEIVEKDIVFKNPEGSEFSERGKMLVDGDGQFEWGQFPKDVFNRKQ